jgi:hypothetical protein
MSLFDGQFWDRVEAAVRTLNSRPELAKVVDAEVDEFFTRHPRLLRTRTAEAFVASLVIENLSAADSQSAPQPQQTQKAA